MTDTLFNRDRAVSTLEHHDLDALVVGRPVSVAYLTEHTSSFEECFRGYMFGPEGQNERAFRSFAVLSRNGERALVMHAFLAITSCETWHGALELYGGPGLPSEVGADLPTGGAARIASVLSRSTVERSPMVAVADAIRALVPGAERVGVETDALEPADFDTLEKALPTARLLNAPLLLRLVRMVKTEDEIARSRKAAAITEKGLAACVEQVAPGHTVVDVAAIFRSEAAAFAAGVDHVALDPRGLGIATDSSLYRLERDDIALFDVGCAYRRCVADTGVTLALSEPSDDVEVLYVELKNALDAGADQLFPGNRSTKVLDAMHDVLREGPAAAGRPQGHGLGLEPRELPFIAPVAGQRFVDDCVDVGADLSLEAGMVINLEIPLSQPGVRSFQIEASFLVTREGGQPLTPQDRARVRVAASAQAGVPN